MNDPHSRMTAAGGPSGNGAAGVFLYEEETEEDEPDTYTLTDQRGTRYVFFGFDADAGSAAGQLWKIVDEAGNVAFVGHETDKSAAIASGTGVPVRTSSTVARPFHRNSRRCCSKVDA